MGALIDLLVRLYREWPLLGAVGQTLITLGIATLVGRGVLSVIRQNSKRLSPGPVMLLAAAVVGGGFLVTLAYLRATGRSFESFAVEWLTGVSNAPVEELGPWRHPVVLGLTYSAVYALFVGLALVLAWLLGLTRDDGGPAREIEAELGTSLAERFYRLAGHFHAGATETRFVEWCQPLVKRLRWAQWVALPAAVTGTLPPALWVACAIIVEGLALNLVLPPKPVDEEKRKGETRDVQAAGTKDPDQLVRALSVDPRGPELTVSDGGSIAGAPEHFAARTRLSERSPMIRAVLSALEIPGFYVHQEAATEALAAGKSVLLETPPLSGRRTMCDVLALSTVLHDGGSVLYLSPDGDESERRSRAFRDMARRSNWRWAIHAHDLASRGRRGLELDVRQPQIVFATAEELHADLCPNAAEWDAFLGGLSLIVAVDLDRYTGARGANLAYVMRRLTRVAQRAGGKPKVVATVAPFGPDVLGFCERLVGTALDVIGPESDSRGAPLQQVLIGKATKAGDLHPAVAARGVAMAAGYGAEAWGWGAVLSDFEQDQQINRVLLSFGKAVISPEEDGHLALDRADALVARLSADKAAMLAFFTRHAGRRAVGVFSASAQEVGKDRGDVTEVALPFGGFERVEDSQDERERRQAERESKQRRAAERAEEENEETSVDEPSTADAPALELAADRVISLWIPDPDPMSRLLAAHPAWLDPMTRHAMLSLGASLPASTDNADLSARHLACAITETRLSAMAARREFPRAAFEQLSKGDGTRIATRRRRRLDKDGTIEDCEELSLLGARVERGTTRAASAHIGRLIDLADGRLVLETDRARIATTAYPGRVLVVEGRRYRVLMPDEQPELDAGTLHAEPERRRVQTTRVRELQLEFEGSGSELRLGGGMAVRFHQPRVKLTERVLGLRTAHEARLEHDELTYASPLVASYETRAAVLHLPGAPAGALHALTHLIRVALPTFVRHTEDDLDVSWQGGDSPALLIVDRHPGEVGFARAVSSDVVRHALYWSRAVLSAGDHEADCPDRDGCRHCVIYGCLSPKAAPAPARAAALTVLEAVLGGAR